MAQKKIRQDKLSFKVTVSALFFANDANSSSVHFWVWSIKHQYSFDSID